MKINPVAIQSYQQLERRDNQTEPVRERGKPASTEETVTLSPQAVGARSRLALEAPSGDYREFLTDKERDALEILFRRFNDPARFGPAYQRETDVAGDNPVIGQFIDMKV